MEIGSPSLMFPFLIFIKMKKIDFNQFIKKISFSKKKKNGSNVNRDWKILLLFFVFFLICACLVDGYIYWKYRQGLNARFDTVLKKNIGIDRNEIEEILIKIKEKEDAFEQNKNTADMEIKDPSQSEDVETKKK